MDTTYESGVYQSNGREVANVIIRECGAGNTIASQECERAINYFDPDCIFFVGIAGSRKPSDFSIGDVIFPKKVYFYEITTSFNDAIILNDGIVFSILLGYISIKISNI